MTPITPHAKGGPSTDVLLAACEDLQNTMNQFGQIMPGLILNRRTPHSESLNATITSLSAQITRLKLQLEFQKGAGVPNALKQ